MKDYKQMELFPTEEESTLSVEDTHVSRFPLQDIKKVKKIRVTSGQNILDSLENSVQITPLEKTWADIFDSVLIPYSRIWTARTTPQGALVLKQRVSVPRTDAKESSGSQKIWATPNTMDHLPQRSKEALLRQATTTRKGRTKPSNLREQVNPQTMKLWPTPQAMDGMRSGQIRKREELSEAAKKGGCSNLREAVHNPEYEQMWPTPRVSDTEGGLVKNVELRKGSFSRKNQQGVRWGVKLKDAVNHMEEQKMWPTPRVSMANGPSQREIDEGNPKMRLETEVIVRKMFPSPAARDWKDTGENTNYEKVAKKGKLAGVVMVEEQQKMFPTPNQGMHKMDVPNKEYHQRRKDLGKQLDLPGEIHLKKKPSKITKHLNPSWVEVLMGFPHGWTDLGNKESQE